MRDLAGARNSRGHPDCPGPRVLRGRCGPQRAGHPRPGRTARGHPQHRGRVLGALLYIHPDSFPEELIEMVACDPRFLPYFDLPFQHASPRILAAMGRRADPAGNLALVHRIRRALPRRSSARPSSWAFPARPTRTSRAARIPEGRRPGLAGRIRLLAGGGHARRWAMGGRVTRKTAEERKAAVEAAQAPLTEAALDRHVGLEPGCPGGGAFRGRAVLPGPGVSAGTRRGRPGGAARRASRPAAWCAPASTRRNGLDLEAERSPCVSRSPRPCTSRGLNGEQRRAVMHAAAPS